MDVFMKSGGELCGADIRGGGCVSLPTTAQTALPGRRSGCIRGQRARGQLAHRRLLEKGDWVCPRPGSQGSNGHPRWQLPHQHSQGLIDAESVKSTRLPGL